VARSTAVEAECELVEVAHRRLYRRRRAVVDGLRKIASRTVADECFLVSEELGAVYDQPKELPASAEG
jgi:hypothetical protein